jgi:hypothetical protein
MSSLSLQLRSMPLVSAFLVNSVILGPLTRELPPTGLSSQVQKGTLMGTSGSLPPGHLFRPQKCLFRCYWLPSTI